MELNVNIKEIPPQMIEFVRYSAIAGFIAATTLVVNINHKIFNTFFKERTASFWWLFVISALIPLSLFLYIFSLLFGKEIFV